MIRIGLLTSYTVKTEVWSDEFLAFSYITNAEKINKLWKKHGVFVHNFGTSITCSLHSLLAPQSTYPHESPEIYHDVTFYHPGENRGITAIPLVLQVAMGRLASSTRTLTQEPSAAFVP